MRRVTNWVTITSNHGGRPWSSVDCCTQVTGMITKLIQDHKLPGVKGSRPPAGRASVADLRLTFSRNYSMP